MRLLLTSRKYSIVTDHDDVLIIEWYCGCRDFVYKKVNELFQPFQQAMTLLL